MSFSSSSNETSLRRLWYFATFVIDLDRRDLRCNGERVRLTAKPFDTLVLLIENRGQVVTRDQLRATVWEGVNVSDPAIAHAVNKARKALGDDTANPQFIHTIWGKGYIFAADVGVQPPLVVPPQLQEETKAGGGGDPKEALGAQGAITMVDDGPDLTRAPSSHRIHVVFASFLYGLLYAGAEVVETSYAFDRYGRTAVWLAFPVFFWIASTTVGALWADSYLVARGRHGGAVLSLSIFAVAAASLLFGLDWFLPSSTVTLLSFQGLTAYSAYLKDTSYIYALGIVFFLLPFHYVVTLEHRPRSRHQDGIDELLARGRRSDPKGMAIYFRPGLLLCLLVGAGMWSQVSIAHIFEHLQPRPYIGLYMDLMQIERFLGPVLGLECLAWYHLTLARLDRDARS